MSQRSRKIALLGRSKGSPPKNENHSSEGKENISLEEFQPVTDWILEFDPKELRSLHNYVPDAVHTEKNYNSENRERIIIISDVSINKDESQCVKTDLSETALVTENGGLYVTPEVASDTKLTPLVAVNHHLYAPNELPIIEKVPYDPYDINILFEENRESSSLRKINNNSTITDFVSKEEEEAHYPYTTDDSVIKLKIENQKSVNLEKANDNSTITPRNCISDSDSESSNDSSEDTDYIPSNSDDGSNQSSYEVPMATRLILNNNLEQTSGKDMDPNDSSLLQKTEKAEEVEKTVKKHYKDKKDYCLFCDKDVTHFARHLKTWHEGEIETQRILSYKSNSKQKRLALSALRKKGNFVSNRTNTKLRPVKRVSAHSQPPAADYLPCPYCLGFYKKKSLYRHSKCCSENPDLGVNGKRQTAQSCGQTALLIGTFKHDQLLKKELFPRMRADEITLIAKKDNLICKYAYSYLKGRKSKGNLDLVRHNTRRLARLLKFARNQNDTIKDLIDLLKPVFFNIIVSGVNEIACYNAETDIYESPTVAMNFGTLIKKCCDLAYIYLLQIEKTETQRKELKILKTLIISQWANEVSARAACNLSEKKWNKEPLLPLTSDLKKLNEFLQRTAEEMYNELILNKNNKLAYNTLKEVIYTQIILLNRRRPAEVAQLKVQTCKSICVHPQGDKEFEQCLTETEKILLNSYSRIVIRGKRGRGVPIILSPYMRKHFDFLIVIRDEFVTSNDYVFHTGGKSFVDGTKMLHKYAEKCGIQNVSSISATALRKHLATVTQLLQFSESDLEQLSKFMGHTLKTHCNFYRLSDSMYQTAKVSKLLLLTIAGRVEQYKGMQLDDINIDLDTLVEERDPLEEIFDINCITDSNPNVEEDKSDAYSNEPGTINKRATITRQPWTIQQKNIIAQHFAEFIKKKQAPKQVEVENFIAKYPELFKDRKWTSIKAVVYNIYTGKLNV